MFRINTWRSFILFEVEVENFERVTNGGGCKKFVSKRGRKFLDFQYFWNTLIGKGKVKGHMKIFRENKAICESFKGFTLQPPAPPPH